MLNKVLVKVCGLTRESDIDLALSLGVDYCGFICCAKSPRGLGLERAAELAARVPEGKRVFVDVDSEVEKLREAKEMGFDYFQVHTGLGTEMATLGAWSEVVGAESLWLAPRIGPEDLFPESILGFCETVLVDTYSKLQIGGTGMTGDFKRFAEYKAQYPAVRFILAGGLNPDNALDAIAASGTDMIDVSSGLELNPGIKDADKLRDLFQRLRS